MRAPINVVWVLPFLNDLAEFYRCGTLGRNRRPSETYNPFSVHFPRPRAPREVCLRTNCRRCANNQERLLMEILSRGLLHMLRQFYFHGEGMKGSVGTHIKFLIKMGARVLCRDWRRYAHVVCAFAGV